MKNDPTVNEIRKGLLTLAVLRVIRSRAFYAAEILSQLSETDFATQEGTLYPLLSRLKREKLIEYEWIESKNGPPRKYYRLSADGRVRMRELTAYLEQITKQLKSLGGAKNE